MKAFNRQDIFIVENYTIFTEKDYSENRNYPKIIQAIKSFKPTPDKAFCGKAIDDHIDVLIIDTAGRLQNKVNLMQELQKIHRVIEKTVKEQLPDDFQTSESKRLCNYNHRVDNC